VTVTAREAMLERVRRAQRTGRIPAAETPAASARPAAEDCLARFLAELSALGVEHHVEPSADAVRARVRAVVAGRRVFCWDRDRLPYDVGDALGVAVTGADARDGQAAAEIGVTGCDAAIAETGSLALLSGAGKPRAASLLPPEHLAVVRRADLRFSMGEFFEERAADLAGAATCTFVSGPSRTADIELTLTLGVHGPGRVIVVVGP
jgi:L-lactate dehydrogenase complex protein LldG